MNQVAWNTAINLRRATTQYQYEDGWFHNELPPRDIPRQTVRLVPVIQLSLCDAGILDVVVLDQIEQLLGVEGDWLFVPGRLKNKATHVGKKGVRDGPVMMAMLFEFLP